MQLRSSAFSDGGAIPRRFTCEGEDVFPPLHWSDAPEGTRSFVSATTPMLRRGFGVTGRLTIFPPTALRSPRALVGPEARMAQNRRSMTSADRITAVPAHPMGRIITISDCLRSQSTVCQCATIRRAAMSNERRVVLMIVVLTESWI
jgi:hypothetical protein